MISKEVVPFNDHDDGLSERQISNCFRSPLLLQWDVPIEGVRQLFVHQEDVLLGDDFEPEKLAGELSQSR